MAPRKKKSDAVSNEAHESDPVTPLRDEDTPLETIILARLDEDKAEDVMLIDVRGKTSVADHIVVASGRSARHVGALADHLLRALKDAGYGRARVEGLPQADWVLIDAGDVIVHLFRPEVRAYYNIEKIWSVDAPSAHLGLGRSAG
ncbi:MAG TPA: ribosome silencing factor [Caulobacteraceae bacterium]